MPFDLYTFKGKVEERALVDSGATANFIDYKTVARLRLGTHKLDNIRTVKKHRWDIEPFWKHHPLLRPVDITRQETRKNQVLRHEP